MRSSTITLDVRSAGAAVASIVPVRVHELPARKTTRGTYDILAGLEVGKTGLGIQYTVHTGATEEPSARVPTRELGIQAISVETVLPEKLVPTYTAILQELYPHAKEIHTRP